MISSAIYPFKFGFLKIVCENDVAILVKPLPVLENSVSGNLLPEYHESEFTKAVFAEVTEYLLGKRKIFNIKYEARGTAFQKSVWRSLEKIPYGKTCTYGEIARTIGKPNACRAVGMACNKNPIAILVPCHRVIGKNGSLTGYAGGLEMKKALLKLECENGR